MAIKPFEIQGSTLTIGGVDLEAGTTSVVIPGVTQATTYRVEEVNKIDDGNPDIFGSDPEAVKLIDNAAYLFRSGAQQPSSSYSEAGYSVQELDDGEIEEITVEVAGVFTSADKAFVEAGGMWASTVADAKTKPVFDPNDWTPIAFAPRLRVDAVENVGGGGIGNVFHPLAVLKVIRVDTNNNIAYVAGDYTQSLTDCEYVSLSSAPPQIGFTVSDFEYDQVANETGIQFDTDSITVNNDWVNSLIISPIGVYDSTSGLVVGSAFDIDGVVYIGPSPAIASPNGPSAFTVNDDLTVTFPNGTKQSTAYTGQPVRSYLLNENSTIESSTSAREVIIDGMDYAGGEVVSDGAFGEGSSRVTLYADSIFAMIALNADINAVYYNGETGLDGDGTKTIGTGLVNYRDGYYSWYNKFQGDDSAYTQIVIAKNPNNSGAVRAYHRSSDTNNDDFTVEGLAGATTVIVLNVYWNDVNGPDYEDSIEIATNAVIDGVIYDGGLTELTDLAAMKTAFYARTAGRRSAIENYEGDLLYDGFEFFNDTYQAVKPTGGSGSGAVLELDIASNSSYNSFDVLLPGTGYLVNDTLTVPGSAFGGTSPTNDATITVISVNEVGGITNYNASGTGPSEIWPQSFIDDGDDDQYDVGNFIGTDRTRVTAVATVTYGGEVEGDTFERFQTLNVFSADKPINIGQWVWFPQENEGTYINWALSYSDNNTASYLNDYTGITNTTSLTDTFEVNINENTWTFGADGSLTFPDGTIQNTAYTGQSGGGGDSGTRFVAVDYNGKIYGSTDGETWSSYTSTLAGLVQVAVGPDRIVYAADKLGGIGGSDEQSLWYAGSYDSAPTEVSVPTFEIYKRVKYFKSIQKYVAVGGVKTLIDDLFQPQLLYSSDGINWTRKTIDSEFLGGFDLTDTSFSFEDIAENDLGFLVVAGNTSVGGFFLENITDPLDSTTFVDINEDLDHVVWVETANGNLGGWHGFDSSENWEHNPNPDPRQGSFSSFVIENDVDDITEAIATGMDIRDAAVGIYNGLSTLVLTTNDGQIVYWPADNAYPGITVPRPRTATITAWTSAATSRITFTGSQPNDTNGEKFTVTGSSVTAYNGTYYIKDNNGVWEVYTDVDLLVPFDTRNLSAFTGTAIITWSHGADINALHYTNGVFYIGNDDHQLFSSTDGGATWTQVSTDEGTGDFEDIDSYTGTSTVDEVIGFTQLADGSLEARASSKTVATYFSALTTGKPDWLTITPRSPDRNTLDTHYGFDTSGMWFTGDNEATYYDQPAYPVHTTNAFPADAKAVVTFEFEYVDGSEDWGVCVYPADGVPHWTWDPDSSRISAQIDIGDSGIIIYGLDSSQGGNFNGEPGFYTARFTYDPVAELSTFEILNNFDEVVSRCELPGRLAQGQDYMIGFDADWDEASPTEKSYFTDLNITVGGTSVTKTTELTVTGEVKLPNTVKGFVNIQGPWINNNDDVRFQSVTTHDGFAYMIGESRWGTSDNKVRIDKYSLTSGELVWTRVLGAGRNAEFNISWTGGVFTIDSIVSGGIGYQVGEILYIAGGNFGGDAGPNRANITVTEVNGDGAISTATVSGTAPAGTSSATNLTEAYRDAYGKPNSIKYDVVSDTLVILSEQPALVGDINDENWTRAIIVRINPVSGDVVSSVTLTDEGELYPYDVAVHPTTGATAVVGQKFNEYRNFGTLDMLATGNEYFDILKSDLDPEHWPGNQLPNEYASDFWIQGTDIVGMENVDNVNYYPGLTGTVVQGAGTVNIDVTTTGTGPYAYGTISINSGGNGYRQGHKIKYLGTQIPGGATPDNDLIISVTSVGMGGTITGAEVAVGSGAAPSDGTIIGLTAGTNYQTGSGLTLDVTVDPVSGSILTNITNGGSNYVFDDMIIIPGTVYANGDSPAHDTTVFVVTAPGGVVDSVSTSNTPPTDAIRVWVNNVDFTNAGGIVLDVTGITSSNTNWDINPISNLPTTGGTGTGLTVNIASSGGSVTGIDVVTAGSGYTDGETITVTSGSATATFTIDATALSAWTMKQNLGGEAFVWTPNWNKAIGGASSDLFHAVTYSKDGTSIYAVGEGRYEVNYTQSLVVKFSTNDGTIGFSKYLNSATETGRATSVATIGVSDIVVSGWEYNTIDGINRDHQFVARMSNNGNVVWKKFYSDGPYLGNIGNDSDIQVDSNDNIYVTMELGPDGDGANGYTVTKLDQDGNIVWSRCLHGNDSSYLGVQAGNRWSSLHGNQLVIAGRTNETDDDSDNGLWVSMPTDGFAHLGGEGGFIQMGAFRLTEGRILDQISTLNLGGTFTPSNQPPNITALSNLKKYATRTPGELFPQHLHKMVDPKHGGLVFGDGTRQTTAADQIPQIRGDNNYTITVNDSGKHIYFKNNGGTVTIPGWWRVDLPVGFTFTIVNCSFEDCYVSLEGWPGNIGTILGAGRNLDYQSWGIPDSGSGSMVTLIKLENGHDYNNGGDQDGQIWMISGPSDIYTND